MRNMKEFGRLIASQRREAGMTQEAFAVKLGITPQAVSKWENGIGYPDVTLFPAIAQALGISIESLFVEPKNDDSVQFPESYRGLDFVMAVGNKACYSLKEVLSIDEENGIASFKDGSRADVKQRLARNCGAGEIVFLELEGIRANSAPSGSTEFCCELEDFSSIHIQTDFTGEISIIPVDAGMYPKLEAKGSKRFISAIKHTVQGNILKIIISNNGSSIHSDVENKLTVYTPFRSGKKLSIKINGSGDCRFIPDFEECELSINGSGDVTGANAQKLLARINGSGDITMLRISHSADMQINGSGDITLEEAVNPTIKVSGSGDVIVKRVSGSMETRISGSGDITVAGELDSLYCKIQGSGTLHGKRLTVKRAEIYGYASSEFYIGHIKEYSIEQIEASGKLFVSKRG